MSCVSHLCRTFIFSVGVILVSGCSGGSSSTTMTPTPPHLFPGISQDLPLKTVDASDIPSHETYGAAAGNSVLFPEGAQAFNMSAVAQGTRATGGMTSDTGYAFMSSGTRGAFLDIGNDGADMTDISFLLEALQETTDRRTMRTETGRRWDYRVDADTISQTRIDEIRTRMENTELSDAERLGQGATHYALDSISWVDMDDAGYEMLGGVWQYDYVETLGGETLSALVAFVDGDTSTRALPTGTADYTGHSYGMYSSLPIADISGTDDETHNGYFTAQAALTADFDDMRISGTLSRFLLSTASDFTEDTKSPLASAFAGMRIRLEPGEIIGNRFSGLTLSEGLYITGLAATVGFGIAGQWGGRFFGNTSALGPAPHGIGGTWGAAGATPTPPIEGGYSVSFIGSFGTRNIPMRPTSIMFQAVDDTAIRYEGSLAFAAQSKPFFDFTSVTQGGGGLNELGQDTSDFVSIEQGDTTASDITLSINVGFDFALLEMDATGTAGDDDSNLVEDIAMPAAGDRRRTALGTGEAAWGYRTRELSITADDKTAIDADIQNTALLDDERIGDGILDYKAFVIDWTDSDDAYYMAGGVWFYDFANTLVEALDGTTQRALGAFVDGNGTAEDLNLLAGTAEYAGHTYGFYATLPAPQGMSTDIGYFAATAALIADFDNADVSGTLSDFLFSTDNNFMNAQESPLEDAFPDMVIHLGAGVINVENGFEGETSSDGVFLELNNAASELELEGEWGGRFFGTPANDGEAPPAVGGTWGAEGRTVADLEDGGFFMSLIGSFGAKKE